MKAVVAINQIEPRNWHSILLGEDLLVAALQKSLGRAGIDVPDDPAYQAVRDVIGQLFSMLHQQGKDDIALEIDAVVARSDDGSGGDGPKVMPEANP